MADTQQLPNTINGSSSQALAPPPGNRISTRSTRKKKTNMLSPKKFCDFIIGKSSSKSFEAGVADFYKECYLESPTYVKYLKAPKEKNFSENQYILAQAPRDAPSAKDFFKMLEFVKADGLIIAEGSEEFSNHITTKFDRGGAKKVSCEKTSDDVSTTVIKENGLNLKAIKFNRADQMSAQDLVEMVEKARKYLGCPLKGPLVIVCKDGATKSGLVALADIESDRLAKHGRIKHNDTIKLIRYSLIFNVPKLEIQIFSAMRCNTFDTFEAYELGIFTIIELCNKYKKK
ncbi:hypothetical protein CAEBREN_14023 [Caenorhabditis brenneri]|uniref:Tyrosine-protein phosphatase domain-containing protein n=1 Tax=Caenorhabditis brenneri TaxID=135651 RepID=G0PDY0_CAEBE|nr:hypothetical protein CAEBREN_14023 [Caenorhabditis brenneri]